MVTDVEKNRRRRAAAESWVARAAEVVAWEPASDVFSGKNIEK
jgi:hypothetical protein